jgi:hypothetical protein
MLLGATNNKKAPLGPFYCLARPERFELPTTWFEARYSIQLSYGRCDFSGCDNTPILWPEPTLK